MSALLFHELPEQQSVWMSHRDAVTEPPTGFAVTAATADSPVAAMEDRERGLYGVQFHPEVAHTARGQEMLKHFLYEACHARPTWTHVGIIEQAVDEIRATRRRRARSSAGSPAVSTPRLPPRWSTRRSAISSSACSSTTALLRKGEAEQVEETFRRNFHVNLIHVKAEDRFLDALAGVTDPERSARSSARPSFGSSRRWPPMSRTPSTSSRARCTPTSSSPAPRTPPRSRATTTSAVCPTT